MSFLNKFKKEFEGLNIGEKLQNYQSGQAGQGNAGPPYGYNANPYPQPGYGQQAAPGQAPYQPPHYQGQHGAQQYSAQTPPQYGYQSQPGAPGHEQYMSPPTHSHTSSPHPPPQQQLPSPPTSTTGYQHNPSQTGFSPHPPPGSSAFSPPPPQNAVSPYGAPALQPTGPCPSPPKWIPFWSEQHQQWYYAETSGRSEWTAPITLGPMPAYNGSSSTSTRAGGALVTTTSPPPLEYSPGPGEQRPGLPEGGKKSSSSHTLLAAAGGFVAGGIATALVYEAVDSHKKKKRHGTAPSDFSDFGAYPPLEQDLVCNLCDQTVYGPYAHCSKCDHGDFDVCRDCLAQGATCEGKGKHRLVKVYPKYECNACDLLIQGDFYHCAKCEDGDWDVCQKCMDRGVTCNADGGHRLAKLYIPPSKGGGAGAAGDSSSDED